MSLRLRINLLILCLFALVLVLGTLLVIDNARRAIESETHSSARLAFNLLDLAIVGNGNLPARELEQLLVAKISDLPQTRHLRVAVSTARERQYPEPALPMPHQAEAPAWFAQLVKPTPLDLHRLITLSDGSDLHIYVRTDPNDEIDESWEESRSLIGLLLLFSVLSVMTIYVSTGRWLRPIGSILQALEGIEKGDYDKRLPQFELPELTAVAQSYNHMAEILSASREDHRHMTQRAIHIREQERRHLARELHDEMGQSISAIKAMATSMGRQSELEQIEVSHNAEMIVQVSSRMYDVVRDMMQRLSPVILDELGLVPAIQQVVDDWNFSHQEMFCRWQSEGQLDDLGPEINICLYRIVQEALTNVVKHARASDVGIRLSRMGKRIRLEISDNGRGYDLQTVNRSIGLRGIEERINVLKGEFFIETEPGKGVTMSISIPLNSGQDA